MVKLTTRNRHQRTSASEGTSWAVTSLPTLCTTGCFLVLQMLSTGFLSASCLPPHVTCCSSHRHYTGRSLFWGHLPYHANPVSRLLLVTCFLPLYHRLQMGCYAYLWLCLLLDPHKTRNRAQHVPYLLHAQNCIWWWESLCKSIEPVSPLTEGFCASLSWPVKWVLPLGRCTQGMAFPLFGSQVKQMTFWLTVID